MIKQTLIQQAYENTISYEVCDFESYAFIVVERNQGDNLL